MILSITSLALISSLSLSSSHSIDAPSGANTVQAPSFSKAEIVEIISQTQAEHIQLDNFTAEIPVISIDITEQAFYSKPIATNRFNRLSTVNESRADE